MNCTCFLTGAGDGNRTHVVSLEGWSSTIELHLQVSGDSTGNRTRDPLIKSQMLYRLSYRVMIMAGMAGIEPAKWQSQSLLPYHLATSQSGGEGQIRTVELVESWFTVSRV